MKKIIQVKLHQFIHNKMGEIQTFKLKWINELIKKLIDKLLI